MLDSLTFVKFVTITSVKPAKGVAIAYIKRHGGVTLE